MAKALFYFLFSFFPVLLFSQNNDELRDILNLPQNDCEKYSPYFADEISSFGFLDIDSIGKNLDFWIETCGYNEAVFRIFVLISIQEGSLNEEELGENYNYFLANFQERVLEAQRSDYQKVFENDQAFFLYIPLRSDFDAWTAQWAQSLLETKEVKGLDHYLLSLYSQKHDYFMQQELNNKMYDSISFVREWREDIIKERRSEGSTAVMIGTWIPIGALSNFMDISPVIGINAEIPVSKRSTIGGDFNIKVPVNKKQFRITTIDSTELTKSTFAFEFDFYLAYDFIQKKNYRLNGFAGMGFEVLITDLERPIENEDEEPGNYSITTYLANVGFELSFKNKNFSYWGIRTNLSIMDYNLGIRAADNLGGNAFRVMLFYRF